ncbi:MAG: LptF/LptG family permease [Akkermansiaceae bacterium]|nr:LptF/LptG family permease [Akkermansiaceae bacterium]
MSKPPSVPNWLQRIPRKWPLVIGVGGLGLLLLLVLLPYELRSVEQQLIGFPDSDVLAEKARPWILAVICLLPALAAWLYTLGDILDRYITRRFLSMFLICLGALFTIWLLLDVSDNMSELAQSDSVVSTTGVYYFTRLPAILMLILPYALLLSLLESLSKLSSNREVIAIIQSGRSVLRICLPVMVAGGLCTLFAICINYRWAPVAEGRESEILEQATGSQANKATKVLYRNLRTERLWMVKSFPSEYERGKAIRGVEVTATNEDGELETRMTASRASWNPDTGRWVFYDAVTCHFPQRQAPYYEVAEGPLVIDDWPETPWQIIKPGLNAEHLGVPGLNAWLDTHKRFPHIADPEPYLTHRHYRLALPFACLVTVMLAAPLAIQFSRRGSAGSIFLAVVLSMLMLLINTIILAFGESGYLPPALAAWLPNLIFGGIGAFLFHRRVTGRPIYASIRRLFSPTRTVQPTS